MPRKVPTLREYMEISGALSAHAFGVEEPELLIASSATALGVVLHGPSQLAFSADAGLYLGETYSMPKLCASYTGSLTSPAPTASSVPTRQPAAEAAEGLAFPGICADSDVTSATLKPWVPTGPYQDADAWDLAAEPSIDTFVELPGALTQVSFGHEVELLIEK